MRTAMVWRRLAVLMCRVKKCLIALLPLFVLDAASESVFAKKATYTGILNGGQAVPEVSTSAYGVARFNINTDTNTIEYWIAYSGLSSAETAAHIHMAPPGANGGVVFPLPPTNPKVGTVMYAEGQEAAVLAGNMYVNIHTAMYPGGEIRGQIGSHTAALSPGQIRTPVESSARGWGTFVVDTDANTLSYYIHYAELPNDETAAHIHGAALHTQTAGPLHTLPIGSPKVGVWNYDEEMEEAILCGQTYVNVHTTAYPEGELRGQIVSTVVPIDGTQPVPPTGSTGAGIGLISIDLDTDMLGYHVKAVGLSGEVTAAHIHGYAPPGANAGIVHSLNAEDTNIGVWSYPAGDEQNILDGLSYFNLHTAMFPGGEVRGQIFINKPAPPPPCPEDLNGSGGVDAADLATLLGAWGPYAPCPPFHPADLNQDCIINAADLAQLLGAWGPCG